MTMRAKLLAVGGVVAVLLAGVCWYVLSRRPAVTPAPTTREAAATVLMAERVDEIVATFRKIIVLTDGEDSLEEALRGRVLTVGRMLFEQNVVRLNSMSSELATELSGTSFPLTEAFLDRVETNTEYHDADKLAFRNVFDELTAAVKEHRGTARIE